MAGDPSWRDKHELSECVCECECECECVWVCMCFVLVDDGRIFINRESQRIQSIPWIPNQKTIIKNLIFIIYL